MSFYALAALMLVMIIYYVWRVEKVRKDFTWLDMFKDGNGKPSFNRALIPTSWFASTIVLFFEVAKGDHDDIEFYKWYGLFWSGSLVALKIAEVIGQFSARPPAKKEGD